MKNKWKECEPLQEIPEDRDDQAREYETWREKQKG
jgi:hypothetical protein